MTANSSLTVTSLDFDLLKNSFINFLKNQSSFKDYNFEGSDINVLISILSYNSFLNAFYLNMATNESFLDSSLLRESAVSHAKLLNYVPDSFKSSTAYIDLQISSTNGNTIFNIPKGTIFTGVNSNGMFSFVNDNAISIYSGNNTFLSSNVSIYEGSYTTDTFVVDNTVENQRYVLSNENIDTSSLHYISVYENGNTSPILYTPETKLFGLNSNSTVFFVEQTANNYELVFGDGVFGRIPLNGAIIEANYRICSGTDADNISSFTIGADLFTKNSTTGSALITTVANSTGGANSESMDSIKFRAPRYFEAQDRTVNASDFKSIITEAFPDIKTVNVYGGEDPILPGVNFGKIFISPITFAGTNLTNSRKSDLLSFLKTTTTLTLTPVITDPEYLYIGADIIVNYDPRLTNLNDSDVKSLVTSAIQLYNSNNLQDFDITFRGSQFTTYLQELDPSIVSVQVRTFMKKNITPIMNAFNPLSCIFFNSIQPATVETSTFLTSDSNEYSFVDFNPNNNTFIIDNSSNHYTLKNSTNTLYKKLNAASPSYTPSGTIDYNNGIFSVSKINITDYLNNQGISIYATNSSDDIIAKNYNVMEFDITNEFNITVNSIKKTA